MDTIGTLIATMDSDFLLLDKRSQTNLVVAVLLYVFRTIDSPELTVFFKESLNWTGQNCINFRQALKGKGYIQKNYKFYIYARLCGKRVEASDYQIREADEKFVKKMKTSRSELAQKLSEYCLSRLRVGHKPRTLEEFDRGLTRVIPLLEVTCGKFVTKKFKFLTQSGQLNKDETQQELLLSGLYAMYRAYPEIDDLLHLKNIGITAIGNRGQNMIMEATSASRQRLTRNEDGSFSGVVMSMNTADFDVVFSQDAGSGTGGSMITCNALMSGLDGNSVEYERPSDVDRQRDLKTTIDKLFGKMRTEKARRFASILMGVHDEEFSVYLGQANDEASDKMPYMEYSETARSFLDIPKEKARNFVMRLRTELKDYRT